MAAGRLRRDAGDISKLRRGKCAAVHEGGQDVRTRRIADQRRNPGLMDAVCNATTLLPSRPVSTAEHFGRNRNDGTGLRSESYPDLDSPALRPPSTAGHRKPGVARPGSAAVLPPLVSGKNGENGIRTV